MLRAGGAATARIKNVRAPGGYSVPSRRAHVAHSDTRETTAPAIPLRVKALRHGTMAK
jgi:hypothetical protein